MAGHTPGPWDFERELGPLDLQRPWVGNLTERRYSAIACGETFEEGMANAALIAAAPDLVEALEDTLVLARLKWGNAGPEANAVFEKAEAVLSKARGGQ